MDNVIQIKPRPRDYFNQESDLYFTVWERPVAFLGSGDTPYVNPAYKAIVRLINDKPVQIGMVGHGYKVIPMKDICHQVESELCTAMSHEELKDVATTESMSYKGGMLHKQYMFKNLKVDISDNSNAVFRVIVVTAYDGRSSFKLYTGSINFFCMNGMVDGVFDMMVRRHTSGLTIPSLTERIRKSIDIFYTRADTFKKWVGKEITPEQAETAFKAMPNVSESRVVQLMDRYQRETWMHGPTVWALYNAATYFASHDSDEFSVKKTGNDNVAATLLHREKQISGWEKSEQFQQLAA